MAEYVVRGAEPKETVLHSQTPNGYEEWCWLPVLECIVRCRDCTYYESEYSDGATFGETVCWAWDSGPQFTNPDGFCYKGERREDA